LVKYGAKKPNKLFVKTITLNLTVSPHPRNLKVTHLKKTIQRKKKES
jgi:hypothetical protein